MQRKPLLFLRESKIDKGREVERDVECGAVNSAYLAGPKRAVQKVSGAAGIQIPTPVAAAHGAMMMSSSDTGPRTSRRPYHKPSQGHWLLIGPAPAVMGYVKEESAKIEVAELLSATQVWHKMRREET